MSNDTGLVSFVLKGRISPNRWDLQEMLVQPKG